MELFKANAQWSTRPADERFESLKALYDATRAYADTAKEKDVKFDTLRVEAVNQDVQLVGRGGIPARLTHWAFGQLCARIAAPASYLRELPATLASQNINHGMVKRVKEYGEENAIASLLFHTNGSFLLRAITSEKYARIWNWEVAERLLSLESDYGFEPAKPDSHWGADTVGACIMCNGRGRAEDGDDGPIDCVYCAGTGKELPALYASDHDMFAFLRNRNATVSEPGNLDGLQRGVIVENSEVGASALRLTRFLYREMCGNHIIWGASEVTEVSVRHIGSARDRWNYYAAKIREYADESVSDVEAKIKTAKHKLLGASKQKVFDNLFGKRGIGLSQKAIVASYDAVRPEEDGSPNSYWGFVQGVTRYSQTQPFADKRTELDKAAGRILEDAF